MVTKSFSRIVVLEAFFSALLLFGIAFLLTGHQKIDSIDELNEKVIALYHAGKYEEAIPFAVRTIEFKEKTFGANHPQVALALQSLAALYQGLGDYEKAAPFDKRSMEILDRAAGYDPLYGEGEPEVRSVKNQG